MIALSQASYIYKIIEKFAMQKAKKSSIADLILSLDDCPKTSEEREHMNKVPYASTVGSLIYAMFYTRPYICYVVGIVS